MKTKIKNLDEKSLKHAYKRLKKSTKGFESLIVRDPTDFLDFDVNIEQNIEALVYEINSGSYHPQRPYFHLSAKSKGINRPTVVFDVKDALVYRFCIEQIENELIKKTRQKNIRGGVKITPNTNNNLEGGDFYEKWFKDWMEHQSSIKESLGNSKYLVSTDIASYYENINLLILKDLVRSDVLGKNEVLNLLFYFLENTRFRYDYEVNTFNGLPQEDIDCSRILAYYFLNSHDQTMIKFCKKYYSDFYRFVDDMSIIVSSEVEGKLALKQMTESLRRLNLVSSIEKTIIISSAKARKELFFDENEQLTKFERELKRRIQNNEDVSELSTQIESYYVQLVNENRTTQKNWIKVLKRFYTLFTYTKSCFFFDNIVDHLKDMPLLFAGNKLTKYLLQNIDQNNFNDVIMSLIKYLYSQENLYASIETNILELFLTFDKTSYSRETQMKLRVLASDIFFSLNNYTPLSQYARALSCLLIYRFDYKNIEKIARHYLNSNEEDYVLKKYLIFVTTTLDNQSIRGKIVKKARMEQNASIRRLMNFIDNAGTYIKESRVKKYLDNNKMVVLYDQELKLTIEKEIKPIRAEILEKIVNVYR